MSVRFLATFVDDCNPIPNLEVLVGGVVVHNQMQGEPLRGFLVDLLEKSEPLLVGVLCGCSTDDFAVEIVECRKQGHCSVPNVVMGGGFDVSNAER